MILLTGKAKQYLLKPPYPWNKDKQELELKKAVSSCGVYMLDESSDDALVVIRRLEYNGWEKVEFKSFSVEDLIG